VSDGRKFGGPVWDVRDYSVAARAYLGIEAHNHDPVVDQGIFAWGDPGTETGHALDANSTDRTYTVDGGGNVLLFLRIELDQTRTTQDQNLSRTYKLQYRKDGGTWTDVTASSSNVQVIADSNIADGAATTNRISGSAETFLAGDYDEGDGVLDTITWSTAIREHTESLWSLTLIDADLAAGEVLEFRVIESDDTLLNNSATADFPAINWNSGSQTITSTPVSAALSIVATALTLSAVSVTSAPVAAAWATVTPSITLGAVNVTSTPVAAAWSTVAPSLPALTNVVSTPVTAAWSVPAPSLTLGALDITATAVTAAWSTPASSVTLGALNVTSSPAAAAWSTPAPSLSSAAFVTSTPASAALSTPTATLQLGALGIASAAVVAAWSTPAPSLSLSALSITSNPVTAAWAVFTASVTSGAGDDTRTTRSRSGPHSRGRRF